MCGMTIARYGGGGQYVVLFIFTIACVSLTGCSHPTAGQSGSFGAVVQTQGHKEAIHDCRLFD